MVEKYFDDDFNGSVERLLQQHHVPGVTVVVVDKGEIHVQGYGHARLPDVPADADTLWYIGSLTKAMLAAGLGQKMHSEKTKGKQSILKDKWQTRIKAVLTDDFVVNDEYIMNNVTVEDALSHRTGLDGADQLYGGWMGNNPRQITRSLRHLPPPRDMFRGVWRYNNLMYSVVADVLETITNMSWSKALHEYLWTPMGMASTYTHPSEISSNHIRRLARGYFWTDAPVPHSSSSDEHFLPEPYLEFAGISPAGSVISSGRDVGLWIKYLLAAASGTSNSPMSPELFSELTTPRISLFLPPHITSNSQASPRLYSLGWAHVPSSAGLAHPIITHGGGLTGFSSQLFLMPNDDFGCATLGNTLLTSHRVGEALCLKLMSRRLQLGEHENIAFVKSLSVFPDTEKGDPAAPNDTRADAGHDEVNKLASQQSTSEIDAYLGRYSNAAYGSFGVRLYKESEHYSSVIYNDAIPLQTRKEREQHRKGHKTLVVQGLGERTWRNRFLIHPSEREERDDSNGTYFDMELIRVHGRTKATDNASGESEPASLSTSTQVWLSDSTARYWAVFRHDPETKAVKMGLRLGNACISVDAVLDEKWEREAIWFEKRQDHDARSI